MLAVRQPFRTFTGVSFFCRMPVMKVASVKKLLILENRSDDVGRDKRLGVDHVFSYCENKADSFPHQYLSVKQNDEIYDNLFKSIVLSLKDHPLHEHFRYRNVQLFSCLKQRLLTYVWYAVTRWEILKLVARVHQPDLIYVKRCRPDFIYPYLFQVMDAVDKRTMPEIRILESKNPQQPTPQHVARRTIPFISSIKKGNLKRARVAIFSDFHKAKGILNKVGPRKCVLYTDVFAPKILYRAWAQGFSVYQETMNQRHLDAYRKKAKHLFYEKFKSKDALCDQNVFGFSSKRLLEAKINEDFNVAIPKLLFDIDRLADFFKKTKSLKSALLDEDISPSKNAFCQMARHSGVKTFVECHGGLAGRASYLPLAADFIFQWGEEQKAKLVRWGGPAEKIIVAGCSKYAQYQKMDAQRLKRKIASDLGLDHQRPIVLVALRPVRHRFFIYEQLMQSVIRETLSFIEAQSRYQFIIKVHPGDRNFNEAMYWDWVKRRSLQKRVKVTRTYNPMLLARGADLLISYESTMAADGLAVGTPVIALHDERDRKLEEFRKFNVFYYVKGNEELRDIFEKVVNHKVKKDSKALEQAARRCLNETGMPAVDFISACLLKGDSTPFTKEAY